MFLHLLKGHIVSTLLQSFVAGEVDKSSELKDAVFI